MCTALNLAVEPTRIFQYKYPLDQSHFLAEAAVSQRVHSSPQAHSKAAALHLRQEESCVISAWKRKLYLILKAREALCYLPPSWKKKQLKRLIITLPVQQLLRLIGKDACLFHLDSPQSCLLSYLLLTSQFLFPVNLLRWKSLDLCPILLAYIKRDYIYFCCCRKILYVHQFQGHCPCLGETKSLSDPFLLTTAKLLKQAQVTVKSLLVLRAYWY